MRNSSTNSDSPLRVGPARYMPGGNVTFHRYLSGEIGIELVDDDGERQYTATVALVSYGAPDPGEYAVSLKGWSENEGVPEALAEASVVTLTGRKHPLDFYEAEHAELTERARAALIASENVIDPSTAPRNGTEFLGDGVHVDVDEDSGMIRLTGNGYDRENVIFLEPAVCSALRQWAQTLGFEPAPRDDQVRSGQRPDRP